MKLQEQDNETSHTQFPYKHKLELREEKQVIMSKIKYVTNRSVYDILDRKEFDNLLDYLSQYSRSQQCEQKIKDFLWESCPKQVRGGILVRNLLEIVAEKLLDDKKLQFRQEMFDIFTKLQSRHKENKGQKKQFRIKTISRTLFSAIAFFGVGFKVRNMASKHPVQGIKETIKSMREVGSQCNPQLQTSPNPYVAVSELNVSNVGTNSYFGSVDGTSSFQGTKQVTKNFVKQYALQATKVVQNTIKNTYPVVKVSDLSGYPSIQNNHVPYVTNNATSGLSFARIESVFKTVFQFIGKRLQPIKDIFLRLFFQKNQLEKTWRFSPFLSFCNVLQVLQVAGLLYCVALIFRNQKRNKKIYQTDKFFA